MYRDKIRNYGESAAKARKSFKKGVAPLGATTHEIPVSALNAYWGAVHAANMTLNRTIVEAEEVRTKAVDAALQVYGKACAAANLARDEAEAAGKKAKAKG